MFRKYFVSSVVLGCALLNSDVARANTLVDSATDRAGFNFPSGDVSVSSYDGPAFNAFAPFASFVSPELLSVSAFTGQALGSELTFTLLSEAGAFDGSTAGIANDFGLKNSNGDFVSVINTQNESAGATGKVFQGSNEQFTLALRSPEAIFTSIDGTNPDGAAHMLAMKVAKAGEFEIAPTSLHNTPPLKFNFLEGDLILFWEDMLASDNLTSFLVPSSGDFDYNDFVVVIRQTQVPEPASALLLGLGAFAAVRRRRRA